MALGSSHRRMLARIGIGHDSSRSRSRSSASRSWPAAPTTSSVDQGVVEHVAQRATERRAVVWLVGLNPGALEVVRNSGLDRQLGRERMLFNAREAIERYQALQAKAGGAS